jgi:hypothetical protein
MSRIILKIILALVIIGAIIGIGFYGYQLGVTQGAAQSVALPAGQATTTVMPFYGMWYWPPFYGFGFLTCLIPLFLLFLVSIAFRGLFWRGRSDWRRWHHGPWGYPRNGEKPEWKEGVPPMVAEWHRKLHQEANSPTGNQQESEKV